MASDFVLIIDDHDDLRSLLVLWLSRHGLAVAGVGTLDAAEVVLSRARPLAVLMSVDARGPVRCSFPQLRSPQAPPTVIMSTRVLPEGELRAQFGNYAGYLLKPVEPWQLLETIEMLVRGTGVGWLDPRDRDRKASGTVRKVMPQLPPSPEAAAGDEGTG
ncbi:MAG: hypothetical protein ACODAU_03730 [Myxococcota bacterium]